MNWTVHCVIYPGWVHSQALNEITEAVVYGLDELGHDVVLSNQPSATNCIVIGAHLLDAAGYAAIPANAIIYNSEHHRSAVCHSKQYRALLLRNPVWDYSADNARSLSQLLDKPVTHVPLGYVPQFTRVIRGEPDIDVLFYGWVNDRRKLILDDLTARGLKVVVGTELYGAERDRLIGRSKVVLNIHHYLPGAFEIVRVGYLLANHAAVVTECNRGETVDADLLDAVLAVPYEHLVETTCAVLQVPSKRASLARTGFARFSARRESAILQRVI